MKIGDFVIRTPVTFGCGDDYSLVRKPMRVRVVYIHPKGRYHVVQFGEHGPREAFFGMGEVYNNAQA